MSNQNEFHEMARLARSLANYRAAVREMETRQKSAAALREHAPQMSHNQSVIAADARARCDQHEQSRRELWRLVVLRLPGLAKAHPTLKAWPAQFEDESEWTAFEQALHAVEVEAEHAAEADTDAPAPANTPTDDRPIGERVSQHIRAKREQGVEPTDPQLSRDSIANALDVSGGSVSATTAWKALSAERQRAKPAGREDAALAAAERGDWSAVQRLQEQEDKKNRRQRPAEDWLGPQT